MSLGSDVLTSMVGTLAALMALVAFLIVAQAIYQAIRLIVWHLPGWDFKCAECGHLRREHAFYHYECAWSDDERRLACPCERFQRIRLRPRRRGGAGRSR